MPANIRNRPTASVPPAMPPLLMPQPPIAPLIPPGQTVDLMTAEGCAVFGAVWRGKEAKLVECPALADAMPEFRTAYDVDPYAGIRGFDDSDWPVIAPHDLGTRRGGGMICFFWFRTRLTMPADAAGAKAVFRTNVDGLRRGLGEWRDAARRRPPEPRVHPGLQHAEPRRPR